MKCICEWLTIEEFIGLSKMSRSKFYDNKEDLKLKYDGGLFKKDGKRYMYHKSILSEFICPYFIELEQCKESLLQINEELTSHIFKNKSFGIEGKKLGEQLNRYQPIGNTKKIKKWLSKKDVQYLGNTSDSTVSRIKPKLLSLDAESVKKGKVKDKYKVEVLEHFVSNYHINLEDEVIALQNENRQLNNTLETQFKTESLENHLSKLEWDYFCTISHKWDYPASHCHDIMQGLNEEIKLKFGDSDYRFYFTTEEFEHRNGNHNHFILRLDGQSKSEIEAFLKNQLNGRVDVRYYDESLAGLHYISKKKNENELYWGLDGNRLKEEGLKLDRLKTKK